MSADKDFLSKEAPPNYKAGIGRGAVGFNTTAERGSNIVPGFPAKKSALSQLAAAKKYSEDQSLERFADPDEEADNIYAAVENRRKRNKRQRIESHNNQTGSKIPHARTNENQKESAKISIDEWAHIPEAQDTTKSHKRMREEEQQLKRWYVNEMTNNHGLESSARDKDSDMRKNDSFRQMIKKQPYNPVGYLKLAELEQKELRISAARKIIMRGCLKIPRNEDLWLSNIKLHSLSESHVTGSDALQRASEAVKILPHSESLRLASISSEPTKARKLKQIHDALSQKELIRSEKSWILAADTETDAQVRVEVLRTALKFVDSANIWLKLATELSSVHDVIQTLKDARSKHPDNFKIWTESIVHDESLIPSAIDAFPRSLWSNFAAKSSSGPKLLPYLKPTIEEFDELSTNEANWTYMRQSEDICLTLIEKNQDLLMEAIKFYPNSECIWSKLITKMTPTKLEECLKNLDVNPPKKCLLLLAEKSLDGEFKASWLAKFKDNDPYLWKEYIRLSSPEKAESSINEALEKWPQSACVHIMKAKSLNDQTKAENWLRQHLNKVDEPATLLLEIVRLTPGTVQKRAILTRATTEYPESIELWSARIDLEKQEGKSVSHLSAEALEHNPTNGKLWVQESEHTPSNRRKRRLAEALRGSNMSKSVLLYGAEFFRSLNMLDKADQWSSMASSAADS